MKDTKTISASQIGLFVYLIICVIIQFTSKDQLVNLKYSIEGFLCIFLLVLTDYLQEILDKLDENERKQ